jgi:hypothetical protein
MVRGVPQLRRDRGGRRRSVGYDNRLCICFPTRWHAYRWITLRRIKLEMGRLNDYLLPLPQSTMPGSCHREIRRRLRLSLTALHDVSAWISNIRYIHISYRVDPFRHGHPVNHSNSIWLLDPLLDVITDTTPLVPVLVDHECDSDQSKNKDVG